MHTYMKIKDSLWVVGFFLPNDQWHPIKDFTSEIRAAAFCSYLNGSGERPVGVAWDT